MSAYWKFDPFKDREPETPAKVAKVAKEGMDKTITLTGLATLAASPAENANFLSAPLPSKVRQTRAADHSLWSRLGRTSQPTGCWACGPWQKPPAPSRSNRNDGFSSARMRNGLLINGARRRRRWAGRRRTSSAAIRRIRRIVTTIWAWSGWLRAQKSSPSANLRNSAGTLQRVWKCAVDVSRILPWDL